MDFRVLTLSLLFLWSFLQAGSVRNISFVTDPELGEPFQIHAFDAGEGNRYHATLIRYPWNHEEKPKASILYIHGFNDYFFQKELAEKMDLAGYAFYAIDLHNYGRSLRSGETQGELRSLASYFPELDSAFLKIHSLDKAPLVVIGHSTGGLITTVYAKNRGNGAFLDAIVLNSPFLDMNMGLLMETLVPFIAGVGYAFPDISVSRSVNTSYGESLHKDYRGEWNFSLDLKSLNSIPIDFGWISAIHAGHVLVQRGLKLKTPILVMHSNCSVPDGVKEWREDFAHCDGVLDVEDIKRYGVRLGENVQVKEIQDGLHDLYLSGKAARENAYEATIQFLDSFFPIANQAR